MSGWDGRRDMGSSRGADCRSKGYFEWIQWGMLEGEAWSGRTKLGGDGDEVEVGACVAVVGDMTAWRVGG